jgi:hypothetical protein
MRGIQRLVERVQPVGGDAEVEDVWAPAPRARAPTPKVLEAMIWPGPSVWPGRRNSSPVARIATLGSLRITGRVGVVHRGGQA